MSEGRIYYVSKDYIVQEEKEGPTLFRRNGNSSPELVSTILKMVGMSVVKKIDDRKQLLRAN
jgi:hypothetical protein